ncbi:hypothetical protein J6590_012678 [Homalodisca vitripennis]|nr:hypothetical protein J6590_012678 [Homalodisca vitripennis]
MVHVHPWDLSERGSYHAVPWFLFCLPGDVNLFFFRFECLSAKHLENEMWYRSEILYATSTIPVTPHVVVRFPLHLQPEVNENIYLKTQIRISLCQFQLLEETTISHPNLPHTNGSDIPEYPYLDSEISLRIQESDVYLDKTQSQVPVPYLDSDSVIIIRTSEITFVKVPISAPRTVS